MIFDIQRFASVTINPGQTYVTATTTEQAYTLYTTGATPQVNVDSLSEEIQALLATGTATGTVGDVTVAIDAEGNITAPEGTDLASLIGQTVSIVGEVGEQTATIGNATAITATTDEGTAAAGEYTLRADATYTTAFIVTVDESGAVTSVSYFDGTTTQTTTANVLSGQTLYGEVPDPTTGDATAGVDNAYAAATAITGLASDTNTANLTYSAEDGNVTYQKDGAAIEGNSYSVTSYSAYTATAANFNLTFDNTGKLTAVEGGKITEDGTGFTVGESTDTYLVTATAGDGTLSGTLTTPAGAAIPVEFTATSTVKEVGFDVDANGTVDLTVTYTDGTANKESDTYAGITYTFTNASDTYTATSTQGAAVSTTTEVAATTGLGTSTTASGTTTTSTLYSGETSADIKFNDTTHTLTFSYADGAVTGASDGTTALTLTDGKYTLDSATGLAVAIAEDAFVDGTLVASELTVTTAWNNGSDTTIKDSATTSWSDGITTTLNGEGNVVTYKLDDTHYYKFLLGTNNALKTYTATDSVKIDGISGAFTNTNSIAFSTDGTNYKTIAAAVSGKAINITGNTDLTSLSVSYDSSSEQLTITPGTGKFSLTGEAVATTTLDTSALGSLNVTAASKSNFTSDNGSVAITLTAPKYESGVSVGGETYSITFGSLAGYTTTGAKANGSTAAYYGGTVTVKAGTNTTTFTASDLTAWLSSPTVYSLGQNGLIAQSGSNWYEVTASLTSNANGQWSYTFNTGSDAYTGAILSYSATGDTPTLTYKSTNATGTDITANDIQIDWALTNNGTVEVTKAKHVDLNTSTDKTAATDAGTYTGDGVTGQLDMYSLEAADASLSVTSTKSLANIATTLNLLGTLGGNSKKAEYSDGSDNKTGAGYVVTATDLSGSKTTLSDDNAMTITFNTSLGSETIYRINFVANGGTSGVKFADGSAVTFEDTIKVGTNATEGTHTGWDDGAAAGVFGKNSENADSSVTKIASKLCLDSNGDLFVDVWAELSTNASYVYTYNGTDTPSWLVGNSAGTYYQAFFGWQMGTAEIGFGTALLQQMNTPLAKTETGSVTIPTTGWEPLTLTSDGTEMGYDMSKHTLDSSQKKSHGGVKNSAEINDQSVSRSTTDGTIGGTSYWMGRVYAGYDGSAAQAVPIGNYKLTVGGTDYIVGVEYKTSKWVVTQLYEKASNGTLQAVTSGKTTSSGLTFTTGDGTNQATLANESKGISYTLAFVAGDEDDPDGNANTGSVLALPTWAYPASGSGGMTLNAAAAAKIAAGTIKFYEGVTLDNDTSNLYAVAVDTSDDATQTVVAIANKSATATTAKYEVNGLDATKWLFDSAAGTLSNTADSTLYLNLTDDSLGDLAYIKFTTDGTNVTGIDYLDANKKSLVFGSSKKYYISSIASGTGSTQAVTLTSSADSTVKLAVTFAAQAYASANTFTSDTAPTTASDSKLALEGSKGTSDLVGDDFTVQASNGGVNAGNIFDAASGAATNYGTGETLTSTSFKDAEGNTIVKLNATDVEALSELDAAKSNFKDLLGSETLNAGETFVKVTLGNADFYVRGTVSGSTFTPSKVYNAAGIETTDNEGLYINSSDDLVVSADGTTEVVLTGTYDSAKKTYTFASTSGSLAGLKTVIGMSEDGTISGVEQNIYSNAESMGFGTDYSKVTAATANDPTDTAGAKTYINATYLSTNITNASAYTEMLTKAAAISYEVKEGGNYTGIIALGSDASNGTMKTYAQLVDAEGANVTGLYAKYTFGTDGKFAIDGLYTDKGATTLSTNAAYAFEGNTITFGTSSDTAITYTLTAGTYSDVTIALTSGTPTLSTSAITNITTLDGGTTSEASDVTFTLTDDISYTVNTETKTMTLTMGTATLTEAMDSDNTVSYDSTDTGYRYTATWNDKTGNGVTTDDTITVVTTALSDTTKMTATATVDLPTTATDGTVTTTTYTLTATSTDTVVVTTGTGTDATTVDAATLGYTFALVDADSSTTVSKGDYFTYTSTTGDTVSGTTVASTETGTLGDVTGVVRYSAISTDGTTTYTFASDATVTAAAEFTINGVTYTANADGTVSRKATEAESIALEQTGVTSDTTTYTLVYDATASTITLTNTTTGASEVTAVTLASEAYITGVDGSKIMIDSAWEQQEDGTYTLTSGNTTYTYTPADEDAGTAATCTYITVNEATAYTFSENEGSEPTLLAADGSVLSGTFSGTYTTVADGAEIEFTDLTTEELIAQITEAVGEDALADVTVTVTGGEATLGTAEIGGETSQTDILYNGNVIATIVDDTAVVNGTTLIFAADGTGTYTTVTSADGVETYIDEEGNLIVGGGNAATIASLDEETGRWALTEDVDNITNTTGEPLQFNAADGDTGVLSNGDSWNVADNELTTTTDQSSAIKDNEGTIHTSDGVVTGANENAYAGYLTYTTITEIPEHYESAAYIFGVNSSSSVEGTEIEGVEGDEDFNIAIRDGSIVAFDDISDNATITAAANGTDITTDEDGASGVTLADGFTGTINGAEVSVLDDDGVQLAAGDNDGIDLISGVSDGASVTAPEGTTFATDSVAAGEVANFNINGEDLSLKGEDDGILINGNEVIGLDENAILGGDGVYTVNGTEVALDDDTSVRGAADGTAEEYTSDDAADDLADPTAYQNAADPADLKTMLADGVLTAAEIASLGADNITIDDDVLNGQSGVRIAAVDGVKVVDESAGDNTIAAGNGGMVRIAKDATGDKVVDASGATQGAILASNADNANVTLTGGAGNDTMIASANDVVNLSNGADVVTLRGAGSSTIAGTGVNDASLEVTGFEGGFLTDADALNVNIASFNAITDGKQLVLGSGAKINIQGTATPTNTAASLTATDYSGDINDASYAVFGVKNGTDRVALIDEATNYQVASTWSLTDNSTSASSFLGEGTVRTTPNNNVAVDFGAITSGSVTPDLEKSFTDNTATFRNVQGIAGAAANTTLIGSNTGANEFKAGSGATTIIGGLNTADTIYGNGGEAGAVIFHNDDQGKDIVGDFSDKDAIWTPNLSGVEVDGSDVKVYSLVTDSDGNQVRGENALTLKNAAATSNPFQIITGVGEDTVGFKADLGAESTYAEDVDFYGNFDDAVTPNKLIVDSTAPTVEGGLNINIGDQGKFWNIRQVDATSYAGDLVVDATLGDDTIIGGAGNNTLWGGAGSDLIQGGSGSNYIKYYMGFDGNDEFTNLKAGDTIELNSLDILGNVSLDDASFATATTSSFDFKMTNGNTLKVSGDLADVTVRINVNGNRLGDFKVNSNGGGFSTVNNND